VSPFPGNHGKSTVYEGGLNVPLIVRGPGVEPGISNALVNSTDVLATLAELAGYPDPNSLARDSISWVPYHQNAERPSLRETVHGERFTRTYTPVNLATGEPPEDYRSKQHRRAIRNHRFKLIERHFDGQFANEEFYDLLEGGPVGPDGSTSRDDFEQNDLIESRGDWAAGGLVETNYRALKAELARVLPPLP
jgi:arylsulfatase A-like enzyme